MRIIQTFWTVDKNKNPFDNKGGFLSPAIHWMMWALSCQTFSDFHGGVTIYTDEAGKYVFERLNLPFSKIELTHERGVMQKVDPKLWALSKIYTYSLQEEPFIHIDGDVAIWEKLPSDLFKADVASQCLEFCWPIYSECIEDFKKIVGDNSPDWIAECLKNPSGYNMGLFGGNNIAFIKEYSTSALSFYEKYAGELSDLIRVNRNANVLPEQYFLYDRVVRQNAKMKMLAPIPMKSPTELSRYVNISEIPSKANFFHAIGGAKKSPIVNDFISYALRKDYPDLWNNVTNVCDRELNDNSYYLFSKSVVSRDYEYSDHEQGIKTLTEIAEHSGYDCSEVIDDYLSVISKQKKFRLETKCRKIEKYIFPAYSKRGFDISDKENRSKVIIPAEDLEVFATHYDWRNIFMETSVGPFGPVPYLLGDLNYRCCFTGSWNHFWVDDFMWEMIEEMKRCPYSVIQLIEKYSTYGLSKKIIASILNIWYCRGVFSLDEDAQNFVRKNQSDDYAWLKKNRVRQAESVIEHILNHRKIPCKILELEKGKDGQVSLKTIISAFEKQGIEARGVRASLQGLERLSFPVIALLKFRGALFQYVAVKSIENSRVTIFNPEVCRIEVYPIESFKMMWNGILVIL